MQKECGQKVEEEEEKEINFLEDVISEEMGEEIFREVNSLNDDELAVLLYYRDKHGKVLSMINGREFGWIDVEHWLVSFLVFLRIYPYPHHHHPKRGTDHFSL